MHVQGLYLDHLYMMDFLNNYASPKSKLTRMLKSGERIKIKRDLYIPGDASHYCLKTLANMIHGPSHVSFEYALSFYELIPEKVQGVTSASFNKNKNRIFHTPVGSFIYKYTRPATYPHGILRMMANGSPYLIASKEKALCDTLSKVKGIKTMGALVSFLEDDIRLDMESLNSLDLQFISFLKPLYKKKAVNLFYRYLSH